MPPRSHPIHVHMSGPLALFTRPEFKVERVSYDVITPSAARGILEAVLWKPAIRWAIERIIVLKPIRFMNVRRNEVNSRMPLEQRPWERPDRLQPFFADNPSNRAQRNAVLLTDVAYVVTARLVVSQSDGDLDSAIKHAEMFRRRLRSGQHYQQPYFGCREFPADLTLASGDERPNPDTAAILIADLGWTLHDITHLPGARRVPHFFHAMMHHGVIDVPPFEPNAEDAA